MKVNLIIYSIALAFAFTCLSFYSAKGIDTVTYSNSDHPKVIHVYYPEYAEFNTALSERMEDVLADVIATGKLHALSITVATEGCFGLSKSTDIAYYSKTLERSELPVYFKTKADFIRELHKISLPENGVILIPNLDDYSWGLTSAKCLK